VAVTAKTVNINDSGIIGSTSHSTGDSGDVTVQAQNVTVRGARAVISSESRDPVSENVHHSGNVNINAGQLNVLNGGIVSTTSFTAGQGGDLIINADTIRMDNDNFSVNDVFYSVLCSHASVGSSGQAGKIKISTNDLLIGDKCSICLQTFTSAQGGGIEIKASNLLLNGQLSAISSGSLSSGNAGYITIDTNTLSLNKGATIDNSNFSSGDAGNISINAHNISIDNAGNLTSLPARIVTDVGDKHWYNVYINTPYKPIILAAGAATGKGGDIAIHTDTLDIKNGAQISSNVQSFKESGGQVGNISITANDWVHLSGQSAISIQNDAILAQPELAKNIIPGTISITSPEIDLKNSAITAAATTEVDAGKININFTRSLTLAPSFITTSANTGNGGDITINGKGLITLENSGFTTSVLGANGNGGNINVTTDNLITNTGVIQANAVGASRGDISLNLKSLIPSYDSLNKGGQKVVWQPFVPGLNVIQAASENGVNGNINLTSPQFNISGVISGLSTNTLPTPDINRNPCRNSAQNSLARRGKGGVPVTNEKSVFFPAATLEKANHATEESTYSLTPSTLKSQQECVAI
jgi:large exoprotein involved in heme utilization and adhesion